MKIHLPWHLISSGFDTQNIDSVDKMMLNPTNMIFALIDNGFWHTKDWQSAEYDFESDKHDVRTKHCNITTLQNDFESDKYDVRIKHYNIITLQNEFESDKYDGHIKHCSMVDLSSLFLAATLVKARVRWMRRQR